MFACRRTAPLHGLDARLGSNCSVNDPLPWIERERQLVRDALLRDIPVLGHCFGGQLLAIALGGVVSRNAAPCIGWAKLQVTPDSRRWFGGAADVTAFNWHYETFSIPPGAQRTLFGTHCLNKGFAMGKHLAFYSHSKSPKRSCASGVPTARTS